MSWRLRTTVFAAVGCAATAALVVGWVRAQPFKMSQTVVPVAVTVFYGVVAVVTLFKAGMAYGERT